MQVRVHVPASLREFSAGRARVDLELTASATLHGALEALRLTYPGVRERVLTEQGAIRQHVNVFVDGENVRLGQGLETRVEAGAEIWILPAVSGG